MELFLFLSEKPCEHVDRLLRPPDHWEAHDLDKVVESLELFCHVASLVARMSLSLG